jgi:hypothetical protein
VLNWPTARHPSAGALHDFHPPGAIDSSWKCSCGWLVDRRIARYLFRREILIGRCLGEG